MSEAIQKQKDKLGILKYNGKDYAVGLLWLTTNAEETDTKALKNKAKQIKADFYAVRDTIVNQYGFGYLEQGHGRRFPAAAATAADILVGEWHGVFKAENGWWYVAVHSDAVAPDGDIFFENEDEAYQHFIAQSEAYRWPKTFVPDHWEFPENNGEVSLDKIFDDIPDISLQPANLDAVFGGRRNKDIAVIMAVILGGILLLGTLASQILPSLMPEAQSPRMQIEAADVLAAPPKPDVGQEINPLLQFGDFSFPTPSFVVLACIRGMEDIVLPLPNWKIENVQCDGRIVTVTWRSNGGGLDSIRPYIARFGTGVTHTYNGANTFTATKLLPSLSQYKEQIIPMERDQAILLVNNRFGNLGKLEVNYIVPNQAKKSRRRGAISSIVGQEQGDEKPPFLDIELVTSTPPTKTAEYFNIPGLSFEMIEYDLLRQHWTYQANIVLRKIQG